MKVFFQVYRKQLRIRNLLFLFFGKKKDNPRDFPSFVAKTDEERIENCTWRLSDLEKYWIVTEKLDGTSCTYALERKPKNKLEFYVCSRNVRQKDETQECYHDHNIYWDLAFKYNIEDKLKDWLNSHPEDNWVCLQGEGVGAVQGNPLELEEDDLYVFNFITSSNGRLSSLEGRDIVKSWDMKWVPIIEKTNLVSDIAEMKKLAFGKSLVNPHVLREGLVYRSLDGKESFKNVSNEYLKTEGTCKTVAIYYYSCSRCDLKGTSTFSDKLWDHKYGELVLGTNATCDSAGEIDHYICSECNKLFDVNKAQITTYEIKPLGHNFSINKQDDINHWTECSRCTKKESLGPHTFDNGKITKEPKCTEVGTKDYTCKQCNYVKTETLNALGHTEVKDLEKKPTCKEVGKTSGVHCSVCKEILVKQNDIPLLPHTIDENVNICTEDTYCIVCSILVSKATGHTFSDFVNSEIDNKHIKTCKCGEVEKYDHEYGLSYVSKLATEDVKGIRTSDCKVCDKKLNIEFEFVRNDIEVKDIGIKIETDSNVLPVGTDLKVESLKEDEISNIINTLNRIEKK